MADVKQIKKIKLSNGQVYSIFDNGALRLNDEGILVTGNVVVDRLILRRGLHITEIDDVPANEAINNVLVQDVATGEIKKRSTDTLLKDIGGISYDIDESSGILTFKIGK